MKMFKAGIYTRLSKEDGDKAESDSIVNQRALINDYLKSKTDIQIVEEFIDDGFSGGNFERPGFMKMLKAMDEKKIDCVIVKDLSRFGRNYIEVGRYIERIFPEKGIRLIAINDNYDSMEERKSSDNIILPFKNLLNDAYLRDISVKIKSQLSVKRNRGEYVGNYTAYGYLKDERNKSKLVIDGTAAEIVQSVFHWYLNGISPERIADKLNKMGVLSPLEYKKSIGIRMNDVLKKGLTAQWSPRAIRNILENEIYTGTLVQGKYRKVNYRVKKSVRKPKEDWVRVEDTHEYIIEPEIFVLASRLLALDTRVPPGGDVLYLFSGFIYCGDCGESMVRKMIHTEKKDYPYLVCNSYKNDRSCSTHCISEEKLKDVVFNSVQNMIHLSADFEHMEERLDEIPLQRKKVINLDRQMESLHEEIERYKILKQRIYEDYAEEVLSREEYDEYRNVYSDKINACKLALEEVDKERRAELNSENVGDEWIGRFKKYQGLDKLTRPLLADLVDKILVFDGKRIEIQFNLQDEIQATLSKLQGEEGVLWQEKAEKLLV